MPNLLGVIEPKILHRIKSLDILLFFLLRLTNNIFLQIL